jgi:type IV secretion system protein VirB6
MQACPAFDPLAPYVSAVVNYVSCQGLSLGEAGYRALGQGSGFGMAFTGLLTIYVAVIGYRLLLGNELTVREAVLSAVKVGLVLTLATQWSAYRVLVFDVATQVPELAASGLTGPIGIANSGHTGLAARVDMANSAVSDVIAAKAFPSAPQGPTPPSAPAAASASASAPGAVSLLWSSSVLSVTTLTGLLSVRIIISLLLALGPGFIATALFDATRGLFVGWLRVLTGTFLAALGVPVVLGLELAVVEQQVSAIRDLSQGSQGLGTLPTQLLGTTLFFGILLIAVLAAMMRAGLAFSLPEGPIFDRPRLTQLPATVSATATDFAASNNPAFSLPSRAQMLASAAQSQDWREARMAGSAQEPQRASLPRDDAPLTKSRRSQPAAPLGQEGRRSAPRQSSAASRRDDLI